MDKRNARKRKRARWGNVTKNFQKPALFLPCIGHFCLFKDDLSIGRWFKSSPLWNLSASTTRNWVPGGMGFLQLTKEHRSANFSKWQSVQKGFSFSTLLKMKINVKWNQLFYKAQCIVVHSVLIVEEPIQISLHLNLTSASSVEHPSHVKHFLWNGLLRCFTPLSPPTIALVRIEVFSVSHRVMMIMFFAYGTSRLCLKFRFHL